MTNADVIRVDQTATRSGQVMHSGDVIAWTADLPADLPSDSPQGSTALALFNVGESQVVVNSGFVVYGIDDAVYHVKDAWTGKNLGKLKGVQSLTIEPHASVLWLLKK